MAVKVSRAVVLSSGPWIYGDNYKYECVSVVASQLTLHAARCQCFSLVFSAILRRYFAYAHNGLPTRRERVSLFIERMSNNRCLNVSRRSLPAQVHRAMSPAGLRWKLGPGLLVSPVFECFKCNVVCVLVLL